MRTYVLFSHLHRRYRYLLAQSMSPEPRFLSVCKVHNRESIGGLLLASRTRQAERQRRDYAFRVLLQHKALSDRRRDDAIPEPLGQLSQRPPAGAVRRGDQLEVEGL
jgi:hypothetical protein